MAINNNTKFGVVYTTPADFVSKIGSKDASYTNGKLFVLNGESSGAIAQGIYMVEQNNNDPDGSLNITMLSSGAYVGANNAGLMSSAMLSDLNALNDASSGWLTKGDASTTYLKISNYKQVNASTNGYVPMAGGSAGTINSQTGDWVLTYDGSTKTVDWFKLPENAFKNDNTTYDSGNLITIDGSNNINHNTSGVTAGRYGDSSASRTLNFGDKFKVIDASVDTCGHITSISSKELTLPSKPSTAGTADKVAQSLTIKGGGTTVKTFDGSVATTVEIKSGNTNTLTVTGSNDGSIKIEPVTAAVAANSSALTTGAQVASYVSSELGRLSGALVYKGTITSYSDLPTAASTNTGHVYICSSSFTTTAAQTGTAYNIEVGDMFISNGSKWNIVSSEFDVSTYSNALDWGKDVSIAVVDGVTIKAKLPANPNTDYQATKAGHYVPSDKDSSVAATASGSVNWSGAVVTGITKDNKGHITGVTTSTIPANPNTDEKVKANTSTGRFYLIGQDDATSGTTESTYKNASVYVDGGYLYSGGAKVLTGYTEQYTGTVKWVYPGTGLTNGTTDSSITSTGTLNLKVASANEIGGVKPGTTTGKTYGVQVDASGAMTVNVPWTDNNDNTWRDVYVGGTQRLGTGTGTGSLKFVNGTNITATWNSGNQTIQFDASGLATTNDVSVAKSEAIAAATVYWETL